MEGNDSEYDCSVIHTGGLHQDPNRGQDDSSRLIRMLTDLLERCGGNSSQDDWSDFSVSLSCTVYIIIGS